MLEAMPPLKEIANVNVVPFVGENCLIMRTEDALWEMPGGTLEPGESHVDTLQRELMEEAGAHLVNFEMIGAWKCHSAAAEPYRAHLPHPDFYRLAGYGDVELVGQPQNPEGAEQIATVEIVPVEAAARRFREIGRPELAELYELAAAVRAKTK
jgi:8-oxo-dGTP pyrophosphatase MutT (NUDIX family)